MKKRIVDTISEITSLRQDSIEKSKKAEKLLEKIIKRIISGETSGDLIKDMEIVLRTDGQACVSILHEIQKVINGNQGEWLLYERTEYHPSPVGSSPDISYTIGKISAPLIILPRKKSIALELESPLTTHSPRRWKDEYSLEQNPEVKRIFTMGTLEIWGYNKRNAYEFDRHDVRSTEHITTRLVVKEKNILHHLHIHMNDVLEKIAQDYMR